MGIVSRKTNKIFMEGEWKQMPDEVVEALVKKVYILEAKVKELQEYKTK